MIRVALLCIDSILLMGLLFAITKLRARLVQCCVKLHYGIVLGTQSLLLFSVVSNCTMGLFWERYRFFYWLLQSCARDWVSIVSNCTMGLFSERYHFFYWLLLVIVDTTAAPVLYIVGQQYSCSLCSSLKYTDS